MIFVTLRDIRVYRACRSIWQNTENHERETSKPCQNQDAGQSDLSKTVNFMIFRWISWNLDIFRVFDDRTETIRSRPSWLTWLWPVSEMTRILWPHCDTSAARVIGVIRQVSIVFKMCSRVVTNNKHCFDTFWPVLTLLNLFGPRVVRFWHCDTVTPQFAALRESGCWER